MQQSHIIEYNIVVFSLNDHFGYTYTVSNDRQKWHDPELLNIRSVLQHPVIWSKGVQTSHAQNIIHIEKSNGRKVAYNL